MRKYPGERTVCAPRAEIFHDGVPYMSGWAAAHSSTQALADALRRAGLDAGFGGLRSDVSVHGDGLVRLGTVPADIVQRLADLLARGLCTEHARHAATDSAA